MADSTPPQSRVRKTHGPSKQPRRPRGRSLTDFARLSAAERILLQCCGKGEVAVISEEVPDNETKANRVRADFVRFLALGGDENAPVHEHGVRLCGAWLIGSLDVEAANVPYPLLLAKCHLQHVNFRNSALKEVRLHDCYIDGGVLADCLICEADMAIVNCPQVNGGVVLTGSRINGNLDFRGTECTNLGGYAIIFDRAQIGGDVYLGKRFKGRGEVRFVGASIGGALDCDGGSFLNPDGVALGFDSAEVGGAAFLGHGFYSYGEVRLIDAKLSGSLACSGGRFRNLRGDCLSMDRVVVKGSIFLDKKFLSTGTVRLVGAQIGNHLNCQDGHFLNRGSIALSLDGAHVSQSVRLSHGFRARGHVRLLNAEINSSLNLAGGIFDNPGDFALSCDAARVSGALFYRSPLHLKGSVDFSSLHVGDLCDDEQVWEDFDGSVVLNGFTYGRLSGAAPTDAMTRIGWLEGQPRRHVTTEFRPQPWEQLVKVLREMGHPEEARKVAIAKHMKMRAAKRYIGGSAVWDWFYGVLVGYGYRPWKLLWIAFGVWIACAVVYSLAIRAEMLGSPAPLLVPATEEVNAACIVDRAIRKDSRPCTRLSPDYSGFISLAYSAEVLLPVISLGSKAEWKPALHTAHGEPLAWGWIVFLVYWLEIAFGWLAGLLLVAAVGGLVKKE